MKGAEPSLHYAARLAWPHSPLPPVLDRSGFLSLEDLAGADPPWCMGWEAVEQWRQLGYLIIP